MIFDLGEVDTEDLISELSDRGEYVADVDDWDRLYQLLSSKQNDEAIALMKKIVETTTGRIIP